MTIKHFRCRCFPSFDVVFVGDEKILFRKGVCFFIIEVYSLLQNIQSWSTEHAWSPVHDEVYSIQHYVITFATDLRQVSSVLLFPLPIKLTATISLKYHKPTNHVWSLKDVLIRKKEPIEKDYCYVTNISDINLVTLKDVVDLDI